MKKHLFPLLLLLMVSVIAVAEKKDSYKFYQFTDVHVMHPDLMVNRGSAFIKDCGYNMTMHEASLDIFKMCIDSIKQNKPDFVLLSGDIAKDGEKIGHQLVASMLKDVQDNYGVKIYVIPGNHDCVNPFGRIYDGDNATYAETTTRQEFGDIYEEFGLNQAVAKDDANGMLSYMVYPYDDLAILCLDANDFSISKYNPTGKPDNYKDTLSCRGFMSTKSVEWAEKVTKEAVASGRHVIAQVHYPLFAHEMRISSWIRTAS